MKKKINLPQPQRNRNGTGFFFNLIMTSTVSEQLSFIHFLTWNGIGFTNWAFKNWILDQLTLSEYNVICGYFTPSHRLIICVYCWSSKLFSFDELCSFYKIRNTNVANAYRCSLPHVHHALSGDEQVLPRVWRNGSQDTPPGVYQVSFALFDTHLGLHSADQQYESV